ncbi:hypothetical protein A1O3_02711 [Capronia epimyces CBS 606.96]|uniref:Wax synthase domain-containing protein n=1 Tax=Capronia epimyces CBS 606.96 TaxID=1182542 RepID=W9Z566_9EURO|nr:uncharacterized protein A1O3_02711 [Capronia epimyces CBS 606.96]EXJ89644.1 hypothetical protein A1O3_02711 [Capronia epimyces CBS 606.96]
MTSYGSLVLLTSLLFEVLALNNLSDTRLKVMATTASLYALVYFLISPPPGSFMAVWPLGMNIHGLVQRCISYLWLRSPTELVRKEKEKEKGGEKGQKRKRVKFSGEGEELELDRDVPDISVLDALDVATTFRGVGWFVKPLFLQSPCKSSAVNKHPLPRTYSHDGTFSHENLFANMRTINRRFEAKGLPARGSSTSSSRISFALSQLLSAALRFLALDLGITYVNKSMSSLDLDQVSIARRLALGALMMLYVRWTMDIPFRVASGLFVLAGVHTAEEWPPLFGDWQDAYTVRRFWSHTWHQGMRLIAEPPVNLFVHSVLGLQAHGHNHSQLRYWAKVFGNFFMAFVNHAYGRILAGGDPMNDWIMFTLHPIAIWIESSLRDVAVAAGWLDSHHRSRIEIYCGYIWVAGFVSWTFLDFMDGAIRVHGNIPALASGLIEPAFGYSFWTPLLQ